MRWSRVQTEDTRRSATRAEWYPLLSAPMEMAVMLRNVYDGKHGLAPRFQISQPGKLVMAFKVSREQKTIIWLQRTTKLEHHVMHVQDKRNVSDRSTQPRHENPFVVKSFSAVTLPAFRRNVYNSQSSPLTNSYYPGDTVANDLPAILPPHCPCRNKQAPSVCTLAVSAVSLQLSH